MAAFDSKFKDRQPLMRLAQIVGPRGIFPVSRSTWLEGVRTGRFPAPVKLGARSVAWRTDVIAALINSLSPVQPFPLPLQRRGRGGCKP